MKANVSVTVSFYKVIFAASLMMGISCASGQHMGSMSFKGGNQQKALHKGKYYYLDWSLDSGLDWTLNSGLDSGLDSYFWWSGPLLSLRNEEPGPLLRNQEPGASL